jgi:hypothetical protein
MMSGSAQAANMDLDTQSGFERRWHVFEKACWAIMAVIVLAAVAGILGKGPLQQAKATSAGNEASVTYQRFSHYMAPGRYEIAFGGLGSTIQVHIDRELLSKADVMGVSPRPVAAAVDGTGWNYFFAASDAAGKVEFRIQPRGLGGAEGDISVNGAAIHLKQFILP